MDIKSKVQILMGANGIKKAYSDSLSNESLDIVCLSKNYYRVIGKYFDEEYAPTLYGGTIRTREILPETENSGKNSATKKSDINQVRYLKTPFCESDLLISDNKISLISYDQNEPYAVEITDKELVTSFKAQFEALWKSLK